MKKMENLKDLLIAQGSEMYDAVIQEQRALPNLRQQAKEPRLKDLIDRELTASKYQENQLATIFRGMGISPEGIHNRCCESMISRAEKFTALSENKEVKDAALINAIQGINHHKITGFGSFTAYARESGYSEIAHKAHELLEQEREIDEKLSELAKETVNRKAELAH